MVIRLNEEKATQGSMDAHSGAVFVMGSPQGGSPPADGTISFRRLTAPEGGPEAARKIRFYEEIPLFLLKSNHDRSGGTAHRWRPMQDALSKGEQKSSTVTPGQSST